MKEASPSEKPKKSNKNNNKNDINQKTKTPFIRKSKNSRKLSRIILNAQKWFRYGILWLKLKKCYFLQHTSLLQKNESKLRSATTLAKKGDQIINLTKEVSIKGTKKMPTIIRATRYEDLRKGVGTKTKTWYLKQGHVFLGLRFMALLHPLKPLLFLLVLAVSINASPARAASSFVNCAIDALQGNKTEQTRPPASAEVAFSPHGDATRLIIKTISTAKKTLRMAAYSLTARPIAAALIKAKKKGINVRVLVDHGQIGEHSHSVINRLREADITIRVDTTHKLQHNKYIIVDDETIETGSFNYSASAEHKNAENVLVLWQSPDLASRYIKNWEALWAAAEPYK